MSTVVEIEKVLQTLPVEDTRKIADWLQHYLDEKWDKQIDEDCGVQAGSPRAVFSQAAALNID